VRKRQVLSLTERALLDSTTEVRMLKAALSAKRHCAIDWRAVWREFEAWQASGLHDWSSQKRKLQRIVDDAVTGRVRR
jgi:hypothetical protein